MAKKQVPWWSLIPTALFAGLAAWLAHPVVSNPTEQTVSIVFPGGGKIDVKTKGTAMDAGTLLGNLFSDKVTRYGTLGWLKENQRVYAFGDAELAATLNQALCDPIPKKPLDDYLRKSQECAAKPVAAALRTLQQDQKVPFQVVGFEALAGVQADPDHRPGAGRVNVCSSGPFVGRRLQVWAKGGERSVEVEATGSYPCAMPGAPDLQLDPREASTLFRRPTAMLESVIVFPLAR